MGAKLLSRGHDPERVTVVALHEGRITRQTELTSKVRSLVRPDFRKSHAPRYNDYCDFVFSDGYHTDGTFIDVPNDPKQQGWDADNTGHVHIDCVCTTDPKVIDNHGWTMHFRGAWDIAKARFSTKKLTRIPFGS